MNINFKYTPHQLPPNRAETLIINSNRKRQHPSNLVVYSSSSISSLSSISGQVSLPPHPLSSRIINRLKLSKCGSLLSNIRKSIRKRLYNRSQHSDFRMRTEQIELLKVRRFSDEEKLNTQDANLASFNSTADGRKYKLSPLANGRYELLVAKPPITQLVFSGGGAKGAGLPGAVQALQNRNLLNNIDCIHGTSVGSITAAFVASGISAEAFTDFSLHLDFNEAFDHQKFHSHGHGLERIVNDNVRKSLLRLINNTDNTTDVSTREKLKYLNNKLLSGNLITFADLTLAKEICPNPQAIKKLNIAITAHFKHGSQTFICNSDTTPDLAISRACRYSSSLPLMFHSIRHDFSFLTVPDTSCCSIFNKMPNISDGGILLNTPIPEFYLNTHSTNPIQSYQNLILSFDNFNMQIPDGQGLGACLSDKFVKSSMMAEWYRFIARVQSDPNLRQQIIEVPLTTDKGETISTLDLSAPLEMKQELLEKLQQKVEKHLKAMENRFDKFEFHSPEAALLALNTNLVASEETTETMNFVTEATKLIEQLTQVIKVNNDNDINILSSNEVNDLLINLDEICHTPARQTWLGWQLNDNASTEIQQFLSLLQTPAKTTSFKQQSLVAVIKETQARKLYATKQRFHQMVIYPSRYKLGQTKQNLTLLRQVENMINQAQNQQAVNHAIHYLLENYHHRFMPLSQEIAGKVPKTIQIAKSFLS